MQTVFSCKPSPGYPSPVITNVLQPNIITFMGAIAANDKQLRYFLKLAICQKIAPHISTNAILR